MGALWTDSRSSSGLAVPRGTGLQLTIQPISAFMILPQLRNLVIQVAIVCAPGTEVLADSIEELLTEAKGFRFSRIACHSFSVNPNAAGSRNPDVMVATLGCFHTT